MKNRLLLFTIIIISLIACQKNIEIPQEVDKTLVGYYKSEAKASSGTGLQLRKDGTYFLIQRAYHSCDAFLQYTGKWTSSGNQVLLQESMPLSEYLSIINYSKNGAIDTIKLWGTETGFVENIPDDEIEGENIEDIILFIDTFEQEVFRTMDILKKQSDTLIINISDKVIAALPELKIWIDDDTSTLNIQNNQVLIDKAKYIRQNDRMYASLDVSIENYSEHYYDLYFQNGNYYTSIDHAFPYDSIEISLKSPLPRKSKLNRTIVFYQKDSLLVTRNDVFLEPHRLVKVK